MGRVPGEVPVRAPQLYPLLRGFVLGSFVVLGRELEEGAELPFAFEEHGGRDGPALYEYRPLVRAFVEEREPMLRGREDARLAVEELRREPAAAIFAQAHAGRRRERGRGALPHRPPRSAHLDRGGVRRVRLGRRGVREGIRRARVVSVRRAASVRRRRTAYGDLARQARRARPRTCHSSVRRQRAGDALAGIARAPSPRLRTRARSLLRASSSRRELEGGERSARTRPPRSPTRSARSGLRPRRRSPQAPCSSRRSTGGPSASSPCFRSPRPSHPVSRHASTRSGRRSPLTC